MSYSVTFIGTTDKVVAALEAESEKLSGPSKEEYDNALPSLVNAVKQNFNPQDPQPLIKVEANGHGVKTDGKFVQSYCRVLVEPIYGILV